MPKKKIAKKKASKKNKRQGYWPRRWAKPTPIQWIYVGTNDKIDPYLLIFVPQDLVVAEIVRHKRRIDKQKGGFSDLSYAGKKFYIYTEPSGGRTHPPTHAGAGTFHDALLGAL